MLLSSLIYNSAARTTDFTPRSCLYKMSQILNVSESAEDQKVIVGESLVDQEGSAASAHNVDERALLRKMDLQFIPWLSFLYFLSFLDRTSIGNAKVSAMILHMIMHRALSARREYVAVRPRKGLEHHRQTISTGFDYFLYQLCPCFYTL